MIQGFTFERAVSWPFSAPHFNTFPWLFGLAYAVICTALVAVFGWLASGDFLEMVRALETADEINDPEAGLSALMAGIARLLPWLGLMTLAGWAVWAMFECASQRRYIWGQAFSLGFGADELRMMVTGLLYGLIGLLLYGVPLLMIIGSVFAAAAAGVEGMSDDELGQQIAGPMLGGVGLMLLLFPVFVFVATRLAPCFGLTMKDKQIRFFDAWNVSRGRFWPILGAYLVLSIAGGLLTQVVSGIGQLLIMPNLIGFSDSTSMTEDQVLAALTSPAFLVPLGIYIFIALFLQGVLQHVVGGPAAFAARHDPRGGVEEMARVETFT